MSKSGRTKNTCEGNNKNEYFSWSDHEVELLLNVAIEFKVSEYILKSAMFNSKQALNVESNGINMAITI